MSNSWYVLYNGKTVGPITSPQLKQLATNAKIDSETMVRLGEDGAWNRAAKVQGLFATSKSKTDGSTQPAPAQSNIVVAQAPKATFSPPAISRFKPCPYCGEEIAESAIKCRHCNEFFDGRPKEPKYAPQPLMQQAPQNVINITHVVSGYHGGPRKSKGTAVILALLLGGLGVHHFHMGRTLRGLLYLIFCWTFIPAVLALAEAIYYAMMSDASFQSRCR